MALKARTMRAPGSSSAEAKSGALFARPGGDLAVARGERVAGVDHHLSLEACGQVAAQLRQRTVGDGHQHDFAERRRLLARSRAGLAAQARGERLVVLEVERGEHDLVPVPDPDPAQGAADPARADHADFQGFLGDRLRKGESSCGSTRDPQKVAPVSVHLVS
jgi:hypothetical protein